MPRSARPLLAVVALIALAAASPAGAAESAPRIVVLDASGSMWGQVGGENKIVIARRVLGELADGMEDGSVVGLVAYGHRREGDCADIETLLAPGPLDRGALKAAVEKLDPKGKTPITGAIEAAFASLPGDGPATVVLLTDGLETCGGDPCAAVEAARRRHGDLVFHVVGFDVAEEDSAQLECAAQAGGGLYVSADDAEGLAAALGATVAAPPEVPPGRLSVKATADGELVDASVVVRDAASGDDVASGRTYTGEATNPRVLPLPDGRYRVEVRPVRVAGAPVHAFDVEIADGSRHEEAVDFSTGELRVGVNRNGAPSDASVEVFPAGGPTRVASGRTYTGATSNPRAFRLPAGTYDVEVEALEIEGGPRHRWEGVAVAGGTPAELSWDFASGTLRVGATRGGQPVDALVSVAPAAGGEAVAGGRTYTAGTSNPKTFVVPPGSYAVTVRPVKADRADERVLRMTVAAGGTAEETVDFGG
jgi:Ca-activated chloride channel family protein